jgi:general secretion pathway protein G
VKQPKQYLVPGFSLVELVIVIVIIGIIAAIAIPRVSQGAAGAADAALRSDLSLLRRAIELYASEHGGTFPGAADAGGTFGSLGSEDAFKNQLLQYTDNKGECSATKDTTHVFGPYLRKFPALPVGDNRGSVSVGTSNTAPLVSVGDGTGWMYDYSTGEIIANADNQDASGKETYDQY